MYLEEDWCFFMIYILKFICTIYSFFCLKDEKRGCTCSLGFFPLDKPTVHLMHVFDKDSFIQLINSRLYG